MNTSELAWFKSSYSGSQGDDCVEVASCPKVIHVRDSKHKEGPRVTVSASTWTEFLTLASLITSGRSAIRESAQPASYRSAGAVIDTR
ncbi:DUF397 domain-containing protein [Streptomyces sp. NPDC088387]|uniref:DUF397 domain-containing protein n=1 Tax=Streptomyces sp. NPDC088387 TaxID=3365859 RepID=UPI003801774C